MEKERKTVCFVIDDEPKALIIMERLISLVEPDWELVTFDSGKQLIAHSRKTPPDVLFSDIEMPDMTAFDLMKSLKEISVVPVTVFVTGFDHYAIKAIRESVTDYLVKPVDIDELKETTERVKAKLKRPAMSDLIEGLTELTPTEKEVLILLVKGTTSAEAAAQLSSSPHTINTHRNHILQKMGCKSILEVVNKLQKH